MGVAAKGVNACSRPRCRPPRRLVQLLGNGARIAPLVRQKLWSVAVQFDQIEEFFYQLKVAVTPSSYHGFLCGRIAAGAVTIDELVVLSSDWLTLDEERVSAADDALRELIAAVVEGVSDDGFSFQLLLPSEELPLSERLAATGEWCGAFLSGVGEGLGGAFNVTEDGREALEDLAAIAQVSTELHGDDDEERDYAELCEYIRVAVQLLYDDLRGSEQPPAPTIH
ncbi:UPF0149 family protein [Gammaproteobacteria bacterium LSUCC0057]|uniref:UPF0149 family protein n=1 Tax=Gammaproteobacteria bacterium LSUCC0057 TaxID=2559237 RepID=A0A4Y8UIS6_9GAMM|nr:UPF0149 family protein [Gammaproteobacteria bacterium LSUCC0057]